LAVGKLRERVAKLGIKVTGEKGGGRFLHHGEWREYDLRLQGFGRNFCRGKTKSSLRTWEAPEKEKKLANRMGEGGAVGTGA